MKAIGQGMLHGAARGANIAVIVGAVAGTAGAAARGDIGGAAKWAAGGIGWLALTGGIRAAWKGAAGMRAAYASPGLAGLPILEKTAAAFRAAGGASGMAGGLKAALVGTAGTIAGGVAVGAGILAGALVGAAALRGAQRTMAEREAYMEQVGISPALAAGGVTQRAALLQRGTQAFALAKTKQSLWWQSMADVPSRCIFGIGRGFSIREKMSGTAQLRLERARGRLFFEEWAPWQEQKIRWAAVRDVAGQAWSGAAYAKEKAVGLFYKKELPWAKTQRLMWQARWLAGKVPVSYEKHLEERAEQEAIQADPRARLLAAAEKKYPFLFGEGARGRGITPAMAGAFPWAGQTVSAATSAISQEWLQNEIDKIIYRIDVLTGAG